MRAYGYTSDTHTVTGFPRHLQRLKITLNIINPWRVLFRMKLLLLLFIIIKDY